MNRFAAILAIVLVPAGAWAQTTAPARPADEASFASLFTQLPRDFARFGSPASLAILAGGAAASAGFTTVDPEIDAHAPTTGPLEDFFDAGASLGSGFAQTGGAFATWAIGRVAGNRTVAVIGADLLRAQAVNGIVTTTLKVATHRTRPDGGAHAFPSGHTSATFATATVLARHLGWKVGTPAFATAAYVALSRMTERRHWASDLAFGAALGIVAGRAVTVGHGRATFTVSPIAAHGGGGVLLTRVATRTP